MYDIHASERMSKCVTNIKMNERFYGTPLAKLPLEQQSVGTMCTDGTCIQYDPEFVRDLYNVDVETIVMHEVLHVVLKHHLRFPSWMTKEEANVAMDYEVNCLLYESGRTIPKGGLLDMRFKGMSFERIARILKDEQKQRENNNDAPDNNDSNDGNDAGSDGTTSTGSDSDSDSGSQGSDEKQQGSGSDTENDSAASKDESVPNGDGGKSKGTDCDSSADTQSSSTVQNNNDGDQHNTGSYSESTPSPFGDESLRKASQSMGTVEKLEAPAGQDPKDWQREQESEIDVLREQAIKLAQASKGGAGQGIETVLTGINSTAPIDWYSLLHEYATILTKSDYSYARGNRRYPNAIWPSLAQHDLVEITIVIDTSCSMTDKEFQEIISELDSLLNAFPKLCVNIIHCDERVCHTGEYTVMDTPLQVKMRGGWGTDFAPAFEYIDEEYPATALVMYFTDMCPCDWNNFNHVEPNCDTVWVDTQSFASVEHWEQAVPFGKVVQLTGDL